MSLHIIAILGALASGIAAEAPAATQSLYGQCGGISYTGPTQCQPPSYCYNDGNNPWYSQCVTSPWPSATSATSATTSTPGVTTTVTVLPPPTSRTTKPGGVTTTVTLRPDDPFTEDRLRQGLASPTGVSEAADSSSSPSNAKRQAGPGPGSTLQAGWYWIRAVVQPNYHKYLQTKPAYAAGTAILESYRTAGQFNVQDGQLVANTGAGGTPLYLNVEKPADFTQRKLATWFNTTKNEFGAFVFQGDALTWSTPEVKRQNLAAWLVCTSQALFINTGAYAYQTPAGCADQTIHYYNDAHANE
ncbi:hypothetical protein GGR51DRAFT_538486 [Nemania sp. FL0031]|nr:hypothetical protein GGR51DRAFT_538486 [Nemania sp. FL0031]